MIIAKSEMSSLVIGNKRFISFSPEVTTKNFSTFNEEELEIPSKITKSKSKTLRVDRKTNKNEDEDYYNVSKLGEYDGSRMDQPNNDIIDNKEKKIMEYLDAEKVDWGDPAEKCFNYYNEKKKCMMKKKNMSANSLNNSSDLDLDSSPLMMRRKLKANTVCGLGLKLKETLSANDLTGSENIQKKILPTKFKLTLGESTG